MNAERIVEVGLGLRLLPDELDAGAVRELARRLLGEDGFRAVARGQQAAIQAMPSPATVVPILEALRA